MRIKSIFKFLTASIGVVLPAVPMGVCLVLRGAEGWKLWHEMSRFTSLGIMAWVWTIAYLVASVVTIFHLDDELNLRWWELLIDAGNMVTSGILAMKCADQQFDLEHPLPYPLRFTLWLGICLLVQITVTFIARRARDVSQCLYRQMNPQQAETLQKLAADKASNFSHRTELVTETDAEPPNVTGSVQNEGLTA